NSNQSIDLTAVHERTAYQSIAIHRHHPAVSGHDGAVHVAAWDNAPAPPMDFAQCGCAGRERRSARRPAEQRVRAWSGRNAIARIPANRRELFQVEMER